MRWWVPIFALLTIGATGSRLDAPFNVGKIRWTARGTQIKRYVPQFRAQPRGSTTVMVVAPWCGACRQTLDYLRTQPVAKERIHMVLIPDYEIARAPAGALSQYKGFKVYALEGAAARNVRAYPSYFNCSRRGACKELSLHARQALLTP
ncbi:MAG: hypothetical protein AAFX94_00720 [Myxococcota bacterium]